MTDSNDLMKTAVSYAIESTRSICEEEYKATTAKMVEQMAILANARMQKVLVGLKATLDDLDNPFDASASGEMHYGFERAIEDVSSIMEAAIQEVNHDPTPVPAR